MNGYSSNSSVISLNIFWYYKALTYTTKHALLLQRSRTLKFWLLAIQSKVNAGHTDQQSGLEKKTRVFNENTTHCFFLIKRGSSCFS